MQPGHQHSGEDCAPRLLVRQHARSLTLWLPGALQMAIERGLLREDASNSDRPPNLPLVLSLAAQIAEGMAFLHARDVLHGDLCGGAALEALRATWLLAWCRISRGPHQGLCVCGRQGGVLCGVRFVTV